MAIRRRPVHPLVLCICIAAAAVLSLGTGAGFAATPPAGTLTDASGPVTYTAGPFFTSNASAQANGTPICNTALACDDFALTVSLSPAVAAANVVKIQVQWPLTTADFDLNVTAGGAMTTVDDTAFVPSGASYMLLSDVAGDTVYRLDRPLLGFEPGTAYSTSDTTGVVALLNLDSGALTTIASGFKSTRGIAFITLVDGDGD